MFYEVALAADVSAIGEAPSPDGVTWTRVGEGPCPVLAGIGDAGNEPWDSTSVGSPSAQAAVSGDGRMEVRLYYGALDSLGNGTIGLAARYGADGPLVRGDERGVRDRDDARAARAVHAGVHRVHVPLCDRGVEHDGLEPGGGGGCGAGDPAADVEAQAEPAVVPFGHRTLEAAEDALAFLRGDSDALIADGEPRGAALGADCDLRSACRRRT